jgi:hypothetical protein
MDAKFKLGQEVFYMDDNKVKSGIVGCIENKIAWVDGNPKKRKEVRRETHYGLLSGWMVPSVASFNEGRLFGSKEDLLGSL